MVSLTPRVFTALSLRASQTARRLAAPIRWWRGWFRTRPIRRTMRVWPPRRRPHLEAFEERVLLGDGTLAGVLVSGWLLPDHSPLALAEQPLGPIALSRSLSEPTPDIEYQPRRQPGDFDADANRSRPSFALTAFSAWASPTTAEEPATPTTVTAFAQDPSAPARSAPMADDTFAAELGMFGGRLSSSSSAKRPPLLPSAALPNAGATAAASTGAGIGGASTNTGGGGGGSLGAGGGAGPAANGFTSAELAAMTAGGINAGTTAAPIALPPPGTSTPAINNAGPLNTMPASQDQSVLNPLLLSSLANGTSSTVSPATAASSPTAAPVLGSTTATTATPAASTTQLARTFGQLPLSFEVNQGQADPSVQFLAHGLGYGLSLTPTAAILALRQPTSAATSPATSPPHVLLHPPTSPPSTWNVLSLQLVGANASAQASGLNQLPGITNYFAGSNPANWHTHIHTYGGVQYQSVYRGIDLQYAVYRPGAELLDLPGRQQR